jgi:hypothetical protein
MKNPQAAVSTSKPSRPAVLPIETAPLIEAREATSHVLGKETSDHPGVSRSNSGRHNILENATNLQLAKKLAPSDIGAAQTGLKPAFGDFNKTPPPPANFVRPAFMATHKTIPSKTPAKTPPPPANFVRPVFMVNKTPPPPATFVRPAFMATHKTIPSKTPAKTSQPIAASILVTAEKERVVPFSSMQVSPYPPEEPVLPRNDYINVSAGATASKGEEAGVLAKEHDSESFDELHESFISNIRDFGYKEASYGQALLDMNLLLGISHAEMLRTQADGLDLTERMEKMSIDIDDFLRDCMKA